MTLPAFAAEQRRSAAGRPQLSTYMLGCGVCVQRGGWRGRGMAAGHGAGHSTGGPCSGAAIHAACVPRRRRRALDFHFSRRRWWWSMNDDLFITLMKSNSAESRRDWRGVRTDSRRCRASSSSSSSSSQ